MICQITSLHLLYWIYLWSTCQYGNVCTHNILNKESDFSDQSRTYMSLPAVSVDGITQTRDFLQTQTCKVCFCAWSWWCILNSICLERTLKQLVLLLWVVYPIFQFKASNQHYQYHSRRVDMCITMAFRELGQWLSVTATVQIFKYLYCPLFSKQKKQHELEHVVKKCLYA